ncbi:MAG: CHAT domain-containing protein, partial [Leptolyngbyaceae cyanobacterium RM2_2_4]|nr:CHAT domain-containing protein [Leptolyngbyaceae cyanobacterium RM2_2_4]
GTLAGGLSEARQGFAALPGVDREIQQISTLVPTVALVNQDFTQTRLAEQLESASFPIVHLATHGQFSSRAEDTFLLTWEGQIQVSDLDQLLESRDRQNRRPIEILILSACQTAAGDKRAALGLAGVAVSSGARSTVATLWSVQDNSTAELITHFYTALKQPGITRAEALRQAQLSLLRSPDYQHPYYWAPFVLVGNWQ